MLALQQPPVRVKRQIQKHWWCECLSRPIASCLWNYPMSMLQGSWNWTYQSTGDWRGDDTWCQQQTSHSNSRETWSNVWSDTKNQRNNQLGIERWCQGIERWWNVMSAANMLGGEYPYVGELVHLLYLRSTWRGNDRCNNQQIDNTLLIVKTYQSNTYNFSQYISTVLWVIV